MTAAIIFSFLCVAAWFFSWWVVMGKKENPAILNDSGFEQIICNLLIADLYYPLWIDMWR